MTNDGDGPGLEAWQAWTPAQAADVFADLDAPWCVVGGWAIELWLGAPIRDHEDLEVSLPRTAFDTVRRHLTGFALHEPHESGTREMGPDEPPRADQHRVWALDRSADRWRLDLQLGPRRPHHDEGFSCEDRGSRGSRRPTG